MRAVPVVAIRLVEAATWVGGFVARLDGQGTGVVLRYLRPQLRSRMRDVYAG